MKKTKIIFILLTILVAGYFIFINPKFLENPLFKGSDVPAGTVISWIGLFTYSLFFYFIIFFFLSFFFSKPINQLSSLRYCVLGSDSGEFRHVLFELLRLAEDGVVLLLVAEQVVEQHLGDRIGGLGLEFLRQHDGLALELVVGFELTPHLGQLFGREADRSLGHAVDEELLHPVVLDGVVPDDLHDLTDQEIVGLLHDLRGGLDGIALDALPLPENVHRFGDPLRTRFLVTRHSILP